MEKQIQPHQQRVIDERAELAEQHTALDDKRVKLEAFIQSSDVYKELEADEQNDLTEQYHAMTAKHFATVAYLAALDRRISKF